MARIKLLLALSLVSPLALGVAVWGEPGQGSVDDQRPHWALVDTPAASPLRGSAAALSWADPPEAQRYRPSNSLPAVAGDPGWIDPAPIQRANAAERRIVVELPELPAELDISPIIALAESPVDPSAEPLVPAPVESAIAVVAVPVQAEPTVSGEPVEPRQDVPALAIVATLPEPILKEGDTPSPVAAPSHSPARSTRPPAASPAPRPSRPALRAHTEPSLERIRPAPRPPIKVVARPVEEEPVRLRMRERAPVAQLPADPKPRVARAPTARPPSLEAQPETPDLPASLKPDAKLWDGAS